MKVILTEDVATLGKSGELKDVADGYARNFLIPNKLAVPAAGGAYRAWQHDIASREEKRKREREEAEIAAQRISSTTLTMGVKVGEGGKLYGSITAKDIADALARRGIVVDRHKVDLEEPLKTLGTYKVAVRVFPGMTPRSPSRSSPRADRLVDGGRRCAVSGATILHVDLDAFFAAVEQRDRPELRGRPVIVGGGGPEDRGVVSAASYEARRFGVRSAMPLRTAAALCPGAVFVPVDGRKYAAVSGQVMTILRRFSPLVEQVSIDEAFLDVAGIEALLGTPETIAQAIRAAIRERAPADRVGRGRGHQAGGQGRLRPAQARRPRGRAARGPRPTFLAPLPISRLWGVGERTRAALAEYGVATIGDLAALPDGPADASLRQPGRAAGGARPGHRPIAGGRRRGGQVGQPRAHLRPRHQRPRGHRAHAAQPLRGCRRAAFEPAACAPGPSP